MTASLLFLLAATAVGELPAEEDVVLREVVRVPVYTEGIVFDLIYRVRFDGDRMAETDEWSKPGQPNGHKILADGTHLVCVADPPGIAHLDAGGKTIEMASSQWDGKPLRSPNDLCLDGHGGFYFTDLGGTRNDKPVCTVQYVDAWGTTHLAAGRLPKPNGIVLRPDGKTLLVADSLENCIYAFNVRWPGKLTGRRVFARLPDKQGDQVDDQPDGICLDAAGNLYVAHYGMRQVQVVSPEGKLLRRYPGGNLTTSNVAFAGPKRDRLYITGALGKYGTEGALFVLKLEGVRGLLVPGTK